MSSDLKMGTFQNDNVDATSLNHELKKGVWDRKETQSVIIFVILWYMTSVICTLVSKKVFSEAHLPAPILTLTQLTAGCVVARAGLLVRGVSIPKLDRQQVIYLSGLAILFTIGFVTLNMGLTSMAVSLCMTLRASEPVISWCLGKALALSGIGSHPSYQLVPPILITVFGAGLSSFESADFNIAGFALLMSSNTCWALRSLLAKKLQSAYKMDSGVVFFYVCAFGAPFQYVLVILQGMSPWSVFMALRLKDIGFIILNGVAWYFYLQCSLIVNFMVNAITHTVLNALRRPTIITCSSLYFGTTLTGLNTVGIILACVGSLAYSIVKTRLALTKKKST